MRPFSRNARSSVDVGHGGFCLLRVPLFPASSFLTQLPSEIDSFFVQEQLKNEQLFSALWVSNSRFLARIQRRLQNGLKLEYEDLRTFSAYFVRMHTRCTPFGLNSSVSLLTIDERTSLGDVATGIQKTRSRPNSDQLAVVVRDLFEDRAVRLQCAITLNSTCSVIGETLRYTQHVTTGERRYFRLQEAELDPALWWVVDNAEQLPLFSDLAESLAKHLNVAREEAAEYLHSLIDDQLLIPEIEPPTTTESPEHWLFKRFENIAQHIPSFQQLIALLVELRAIDAQPFYVLQKHRLNTRLEENQTEALLSTRRSEFQIDLFRDFSGATLGENIVRSVADAALALAQFQRALPDPLAEFKDRFRRRFEDNEVPLLWALDSDSGIALEEERYTERSLLEGLELSGSASRRDLLSVSKNLLEIFTIGMSRPDRSVELPISSDSSDLNIVEPKLPHTFSALARVLSQDESAMNRGEFAVICDAFLGPNGAALFARFCRSGDKLTPLLKSYIARNEEAAEPNVDFVEVAHLPQDRIGNVIYRPQLRPKELCLLGTQSDGATCVISAKDLNIVLLDDVLVVRSSKTGRRIKPRITNAHNYSRFDNLPLYRFLGMLQTQESTVSAFEWGPLTDVATVLPRVTAGNAILAVKQWRPTDAQIKVVLSSKDAKSFERNLLDMQSQLEFDSIFYCTSGDQRVLCCATSRTSHTLLRRIMTRPRSTWHFEEAPEYANQLWCGTPVRKYAAELLIPLRATSY